MREPFQINKIHILFGFVLFVFLLLLLFLARNPIQPLPADEECEMSLKQFGSITDLLTKLRSDLRASFPRYAIVCISYDFFS